MVVDSPDLVLLFALLRNNATDMLAHTVDSSEPPNLSGVPSILQALCVTPNHLSIALNEPVLLEEFVVDFGNLDVPGELLVRTLRERTPYRQLTCSGP